MLTVAEAIALALKHYQNNDLAAAERSCNEILQADPGHAEATHLLGMIAHRVGKHDKAVEYIQKAITLQELGKAALNSNLGLAYQSLGKPDEAAACYRQAIALKPNFSEAHFNLGNVLQEQGKLDDAIACYRRAIALKPESPEAHNNLGHALQEQGHLEEAIACYRQAIALKPDHVEALNNLGLSLQEQGRREEASTCYDQALKLNPQLANAHLNRSFLLLSTGNFAEGWKEYEWRWQCKPLTPPSFPQPRWDGSDLKGKTILLYAEQGLGDTLQFVRYAPLVKKRGGTVLLGCQKALARLLESAKGIDRLVPFGSGMPAFDVYIPLISLPGLFGTTADNVPGEVPYLSANAGLVDHWRKQFESIKAFKVGIAWQGNSQYKGDRQRSIPLAQFTPLAWLDGVRLISLQKVAGVEQIAPLADRLPILDLGDRLDEASGPFMDTAAVMKNLDLIITSDTAVAHLAGALGVPTWVALPAVPDWRWLLDREDSPWYPTMRLFRQKERGNWEEVFQRIARELKALVAKAPRQRPVTVEISAGELFDKIAILEIKSERMKDAEKLRNVHVELATLLASRDRTYGPSEKLTKLVAELRTVNEALWQIEDDIRRCEAAGDFGAKFVELARSVYRQNDKRAAVKRKINELLGSRLIEEKSYAKLPAADARPEKAGKR
jgi:tetratricopeptide (TPR) repeat protein